MSLRLMDFLSRNTNFVIEITDTSNVVIERMMTDDRVKIDKMRLFIELRSKERYTIPHFHVFVEGARKTNSGNKKSTFHTCVCLAKPEYFTHAGYTGKFTDDGIDELIDVLNSPYYKNESDSIWKAMIKIWMSAYPKSTELYPGLSMPDYTKLKGK